jgi:hypothetical protein
MPSRSPFLIIFVAFFMPHVSNGASRVSGCYQRTALPGANEYRYPASVKNDPRVKGLTILGGGPRPNSRGIRLARNASDKETGGRGTADPPARRRPTGAAPDFHLLHFFYFIQSILFYGTAPAAPGSRPGVPPRAYRGAFGRRSMPADTPGEVQLLEPGTITKPDLLRNPPGRPAGPAHGTSAPGSPRCRRYTKRGDGM